MDLIEVLKWIALIAAVLCVIGPLLAGLVSAFRGNGSESRLKVGCGCVMVTLVTAFWAAVIACVVKAIMRCLL